MVVRALIHRTTMVVREVGGSSGLTLPSGVWAFTPTRHKTSYKGKDAIYYLGPRAQAIVQKWLAKAIEEKREHLFPSRLKSRPHMREDSYTNEIAKACVTAGCEEWSPGQLRHNFLTRMDRALGIEHASIAVGHSSISTTEIYVEKNVMRAAQNAAKMG